MLTPTTVDVLIVGAGPVGLITAIGLEQQGVTSLIIEKRYRDEQATYGRAASLFARSLELLEQVDLTEDLVQEGFISRGGVNFKDGKRVDARGWNLMYQHSKRSFHDYNLNLRQRYTEDVFRNRYANQGKTVWEGWELVQFSIDTTPDDGCNISAVLNHSSLGEKHVRSKYIVGADGGSSTVRRLASIAEDVDPTTHQWIRIDGKMSTDMPNADVGFGSIATSDYGHILWVKTDKDAHRIGYALTPSLLAKYPHGISIEEATAEAAEGMKPFKLSIDRIDWWTHYKIKQSVVKQFQKEQFILLAGDAAHTHSSGFAQGMNTGVHDATNLVWKLAGTCKGWYEPCVLESYAQERHAAATHLIDVDKKAAACISGDIPKEYAGRGKTAGELVTAIFMENVGFNIGLDVSYESSVLTGTASDITVKCGGRAPDALVYEPGTQLPIRLYSAMLRDGGFGRWSILVFVGNKATNSGLYSLMTETLSKLVKRHPGMIRLITILGNATGSAWDALGRSAWGKFYLDLHGKAHSGYGVDLSQGAIAVLRPDNIFAFGTDLKSCGEVGAYFEKFTLN
ncbi:FAD/NAD(P)-binding domain-containing protein [Periconia macrospinosa]|uniref:FAD/NAD(P)-binding domain-containing protein n=1 Tax=Periconia macrospinosa TaxID=97972 RepID=A0A2V1DPP9_9PLEO|nr:FAD/NAD(P)-binding domain-containing protein [Periconia macrospinosa]